MTYVTNLKEVTQMPGRDGTGPMGYGTLTGRGFGRCPGANAVPYGAGFGLGLRRGFGCMRGFGRPLTNGQATAPTQRELLTEQKRRLELSLEAVSKSLDSL